METHYRAERIVEDAASVAIALRAAGPPTPPGGVRRHGRLQVTLFFSVSYAAIKWIAPAVCAGSRTSASGVKKKNAELTVVKEAGEHAADTAGETTRLAGVARRRADGQGKDQETMDNN